MRERLLTYSGLVKAGRAACVVLTATACDPRAAAPPAEGGKAPRAWGATPTAIASATPTLEVLPEGGPTAGQALELSVMVRARQVLVALQGKSPTLLASLVHPRKGVRFSPYSYVDPQSDVVLTRDEIAHAFADPRVRTWGAYDGSGEPIRATFADYFAHFVWDRDFSSAREVSINRPLSGGNTTNNAADVYKGAFIVEFFATDSPGPAGQDSFDWRALRIVLERDPSAADTLFLVGIIHSEWTI
jgi:hypothetical protein